MLKRAVAFMRAHPGRVVWLKARNALYLFSPQLLPRDAKSIAAFAVMDGDTVRIVNAPRRPRLEDVAHTAAQSCSWRSRRSASPAAASTAATRRC